MTAAKTNTRLGALYRRIARKRGKQKAIVAVSRVICEIAWILICDSSARFTELGPDYYSPRSPARQIQARIREIERLNPGMKVILAPADAAAPQRSVTGPSPATSRAVTLLTVIQAGHAQASQPCWPCAAAGTVTRTSRPGTTAASSST